MKLTMFYPVALVGGIIASSILLGRTIEVQKGPTGNTPEQSAVWCGKHRDDCYNGMLQHLQKNRQDRGALQGESPGL